MEDILGDIGDSPSPTSEPAGGPGQGADEIVVLDTRPTPLAVWWKYLAWIYVMVLGIGFPVWLEGLREWGEGTQLLKPFIGIIEALYWGTALVVPAVFITVARTEWRWTLGAIGFVIAGVTSDWLFASVGAHNRMLVLFGIGGFALTELGRRTTRYVLTDRRLIIRGSLRSSGRIVDYSDIVDIVVLQGVLGRLLGYGDVIPVTGAGFGTGQDVALLTGGGGAKIPGLPFLGAAVTGGRTTTVPRATAETLREIADPDEVMQLISRMREKRRRL